MSDREYWQKYRSHLVSQVDLMRAVRTNTFGNDAMADMTFKDIREVRQIRDAEKHLVMVERLLAHAGHLE